MLQQEENEFVGTDREASGDGEDSKNESEKEAVKEEMPLPKKV